MKKNFVIDTSVIVRDPNFFLSFNNSNIIIPIAVIDELDKLKTRFEQYGLSARIFLRKLEDISKNDDISKGISIENNITIRVDPEYYGSINDDKNYGDNKILAFCKEVSKNKKIILVSNDLNLRLRARAIGVDAEEYKKENIISSTNDVYTGFTEIPVTSKFIDGMYKSEFGELNLKEFNNYEIYPNQFIKFFSETEDKSVICRYVGDGKYKSVFNKRFAFGLEAKNFEQKLALDLLFDDEVKLITLSGPSGVGKTLLSVAAGMEQVLEKKTYGKLLVTKSLQTVGKEIGALPGSKYEKMAPYIQSVMDNVDVLFSNSKNNLLESKKKNSDKKVKSYDEQNTFMDPYLEILLQKGVLEVEAIAYMRGRSINNCFMLIEECQNIDINQIKTIISRCGFGTKIICNGDIEQVDSPYLSGISNGLTHVIEKFKDQKIAAHLTLVKGERSELATIASKIL